MSRLWIIPAGFILLAAVVSAGTREARNKAQLCVPFAQKEVPDENDGNWESRAYAEGYAKETYYYAHKNQVGLNLGVHYYFGQLAFKAWACNNSKRPENSKNPKDREDHMIASWKEDKWHTVYAQAPKQEVQKDSSGRWLSVKITLIDQEGKVVTERIITPRPQ